MHLFFTLILELFLFSLFNLFINLFKAPKIEKIVLNMTDKTIVKNNKHIIPAMNSLDIFSGQKLKPLALAATSKEICFPLEVAGRVGGSDLIKV